METVRLRKCFQEVRRWGRERRRSWKPSKVCSGLFTIYYLSKFSVSMHLSVGSSKPCCGNDSISEFRAQVKRFRNCSYSPSRLVFLSSRSAPLHRNGSRMTGCSVAWRHKEQLRTVLDYIGSTYSYFEKGCRKNVHATIPKGNMGYDQYTVLTTVTVGPTLVAFL